MEIMPCRFELPGDIKRFKPTSKADYGAYLIEPLPSGYGQTIGHALRQILTSAIHGAYFSIIDPLDGNKTIHESETEYIRNLKGIRVNLYTDGPLTLTLKATGPDPVTVGDIQSDLRVEFLNPKHHLATVKAGACVDALIEIRRGAYPSAERNPAALGSFQHVRQVRYRFESQPTARYEEGDRVILQLWTDGEMSPDQAMTQAMQVLRQQYALYGAPKRHIVFAEAHRAVSRIESELAGKLAMSVNEIELSVRAANCLNNANIQTIGDLVKKSEGELLRYRNFGRTSLLEIKSVLVGMGLSLGMTDAPTPIEEAVPTWPEAMSDTQLSRSVNELDLSVRAMNCLNNANIQTIGELVAKSDAELLKYRNFGRSSLAEIKTALAEMGLAMGMKMADSLKVPNDD